MGKQITTAQAAALLAERGVRVRGNKPGARTVEVWCKRGLIKADRIGGPRRGIYLISEDDLKGFQPPKLGRQKTGHNDSHNDSHGGQEVRE